MRKKRGGRPTRFILSSEPGTLWHHCEQHMFVKKLDLRSPKTQHGYGIALRHFALFLGRQPVLEDLDDDTVVAWMKQQLASGESVYTTRERTGRVLTLWNWLARRGVVGRFPTIRRPPAPQISPVALTEAQLKVLLDACQYEPGKIAGIRAGWWWQAFLAFVFSTSERRSAALATRWEWINIDRKVIHIPPRVRKGAIKAGIYRLWPEVVPLLDRIREPARDLVFPWDASLGAYFYRYGRILERAGLPNDRRHKTHCLRVSHATWLKVMGGDPTRRLGHASAETTAKHYLDESLLPADETVMFVPWGGGAEVVVPIPPPAPPESERQIAEVSWL
jgi:integrase